MTVKEKTRALGAQVQMRHDRIRREYPRRGDSEPEIWIPRRRRGNRRDVVRDFELTKRISPPDCGRPPPA